jgi:hypothetical protein
MMEAAHTFETSVNFNVTSRRYIPEDTKLHIHRRENLKSHIENLIALLMEALRTSETSVNFNVTTRRCIPED